MPFTEQQVQMMSSGNEIIRKMYKQVCNERIEEDKRKHEEEIKAQMQSPTEEELQKSIQDLATYTPYHIMKMHPREHIPHIPRDPQPFYTKFLNKRKKRK